MIMKEMNEFEGRVIRTRTYHDPAVKAGLQERWCRYGRLPVWCHDRFFDDIDGGWPVRFHCDMLVRMIAGTTSSARQGGRATEGSYIRCMSCEKRNGYNTSVRWRAARLFAKYPVEFGG